MHACQKNSYNHCETLKIFIVIISNNIYTVVISHKSLFGKSEGGATCFRDPRNSQFG